MTLLSLESVPFQVAGSAVQCMADVKGRRGEKGLTSYWHLPLPSVRIGGEKDVALEPDMSEVIPEGHHLKLAAPS
jgi:hypothetical protein